MSKPNPIHPDLSEADGSLAQERIESLKAGILTGLVAGLSYALFLELAEPMASPAQLPHLALPFWLMRLAIGGFSGVLFGVTYRYVIRQDPNPQLKAGAVMAFGLVRGFAQVEILIAQPASILHLAIHLGASLLPFALAALWLDWCFRQGWVRRF